MNTARTISVTRSLPTLLRVGFLEGQTEDEAKRWVTALAEQLGLLHASYRVFPHGDGWAYELHEAGHGHSVLEKILAEVNRDGAGYSPDSPLIYYAKTATYLLGIEAHPKRVGSMIIPDLALPDGELPIESEETRAGVVLLPLRWLRVKRLLPPILIGVGIGALAATAIAWALP